jgi:hypothetical protein
MFTNSNAYGLLYTLSSTHLLYDARSLYYPIRVRQSGSLSVLECTVLNRLIITFFVLAVKEPSNATFCGKYYRTPKFCKRLSTIRLMNAVSWRDMFTHIGILSLSSCIEDPVILLLYTA